MAKVGRKEILSEQVARKICRMIEKMPDTQIPVTWNNVVKHTEKRIGHKFNRQMLGQKEWNGRPLIAEAFSEAKEVQKRMKRDGAPKYKSASRAVLQRRITELEAKNLALQEELEKERAQKIEELDAFLNTRCDLRNLVQRAINQDESEPASDPAMRGD